MTGKSERGASLIDARGLKCPWPVLRAAKAMRTASEVVLLTDDPVARSDVPALAQSHGWTIALVEEADHCRFLLGKRHETAAC